MAQNETNLWTLNRLACGPRTGFQIGHFRVFWVSLILLETPIFIVFLYKFQFKMLKCWAQSGQNFRPSKTNLNKCRAVLWSLNRRSKWDLEIKQKQKKHLKNVNNTKPNVSFCRTEPFRTKIIKNVFLMALGCWPFCGQRPVMTTAKKHYKTRGFVVVLVVVFFVARCCPNSNNLACKFPWEDFGPGRAIFFFF